MSDCTHYNECYERCELVKKQCGCHGDPELCTYPDALATEAEEHEQDVRLQEALDK